jgi:AcrR family transcriptional regulator
VPPEGSGPRSDSARAAPELVVLGERERPRERADAARNRERVLAAAATLFAEKGVGCVSMDEVAAAAGVGKGTLFRRFGDKAGLAVALLDDRERDLQAAILRGPPPLGPGAPPAQRLVAFLEAYLRHAEAHLELVRMSETASPGARYRVGSYRFWHRHVALLLAAADAGATADTGARADTDALAHALLAPLSAELLHGLGAESLPAHRAAVTALARCVTGSAGASTATAAAG